MMTSFESLGPRPVQRGDLIAVKLGNPYGPHAQEYERVDFENQRSYLVDLGYRRGSASAAVNLVHDTNVYLSDLYQGTKYQGVSAEFVRLPNSTKQRAVMAIIDEDRYREAVLEGNHPYHLLRARAAADLLLRLAELPALDA